MKITVLLFAQLRDAAGGSPIELTMDNGTVGNALEELCRLHPSLELHLQRAQTAWNEVYCKRDTPLQDGGTLALIPPVSGGGI